MIKFFHSDNLILIANEQTTETTFDEKQLFDIFADNLHELRIYCKLTLTEIAKLIDIPNQTLSSYENKTHIPSMMQAIKISAYFGLTVEEFILCGLDSFKYDITELYEKRKNSL